MSTTSIQIPAPASSPVASQQLRVGIVTDVACDLPRSFLERHSVTLLPVTVEGHGDEILDVGDAAVGRVFIERMRARGDAHYGLRYLSPGEFRQLFLERLVLRFDHVFCITTAGNRAPVASIANKAIEGIISDAVMPRFRSGLKELFRIDVVDSGLLFAGLGAAVAQAALANVDRFGVAAMASKIQAVCATTQTYMVPRTLTHLYQRGRETGDRSLGAAKYVLGSAFNVRPIVRCFRGVTEPVAEIRGFGRACERLFEAAAQVLVRGKSCGPVVTVSIGGDPAQLHQMPGFGALELACKKCGVELLTSVSSPVSSVYLGPGVITLGISTLEKLQF